MKRSKITREQIVKLVNDKEGDRTAELKVLLAKLKVRVAGLQRNKHHIENSILVSKSESLQALESEVSALREKKEKQNVSELRLKTLSFELQKKMEQYLHDSKVAQLEEHKARERLSAAFGEQVKHISAVLNDLEARKLAMFDENVRLREELTKCLDEAGKTTELVAPREPGAENAEELQLNHEYEQMIFEDYRSEVMSIEEKENCLQEELSYFSARFEMMSDEIRASNASLIEKKTQSSELDGSLVRLENQYTRSRDILNELKAVVKAQKALRDTNKAATDASKAKLDKYEQIRGALTKTIAELEEGIQAARQIGTAASH